MRNLSVLSSFLHLCELTKYIEELRSIVEVDSISRRELCTVINTVLKKQLITLHEDILGCGENQGLRTLWITAITDDKRLLLLPLCEDAHPSEPWFVEYDAEVQIKLEDKSNTVDEEKMEMCEAGKVLVELLTLIDDNTFSPDWKWGYQIRLPNEWLKKVKHMQSRFFRPDYTNKNWLIHKDVKKRKEPKGYAYQVTGSLEQMKKQLDRMEHHSDHQHDAQMKLGGAEII
jgi:hypothetical protein